MSEFYEALKRATSEAEKSAGGSTTAIATRYWPEIKSNGALDPCPGCQKKGKCSIFTKDGVELIKCHYSSCELNKTRGAIELIKWHEGLNHSEACNALCEYAGVEIPKKEDFPFESKKTKKAKKAKKEEQRSSEEQEVDDIPFPSKEIAKSESSDAEPAREDENLYGDFIKIPEEPNPYEWVWKQLELSNEHRVDLQTNSGFDDKTITNYGFKTSCPENEERLKAITMVFEMEELLDTGIYLVNKKQEYFLNKQLLGLGLLPKNEQTDDRKMGMTIPLLIPYTNSEGRITNIRPHKTGLSNKNYLESQNLKTVEEILYYRGNSHPFNALHGDFEHDWAVVCEGEKKAVALSQVGIPAVALPGIFMITNRSCRNELVKMLREYHIKNLIVVYDKEDKTHRPDPDDHYITEAYAQITCHFLQKEMFWTKYNDLPEEWMVDGKCDWDSRLAHIKKHSRNAESCNKKAFAEFFSVIKQAKPYSALQKEIFYESEKERLIRTIVTKRTYTPNILEGGEEQLKLAKTITKCHPDYLEALDAWTVRHKLLDVFGCYYVMKPHNRKDANVRAELKDLAEIIETLTDRLRDKSLTLSSRGEYSAALALAEFRLEGNIERLSDFTMKCEYKIVGTDGKHRSLLKFKNKRGESTKGLVTPDSKHITSPDKFREFCKDVGSYNWLSGGRELNMLMLDIDTLATGKTIYEIPTIGWHADSKLYFFADCAIRLCGKIILPDHNYVIWNDGIGYRISPDDLEKFAMGAPPKLFQHLTLSAEDELAEIMKDPEAEKEAVKEIFVQQTGDLINSFGGLQGPMVLFGLLGYAAHAEMKQTPGIWVEGMMGSGKSETSHLLMRNWGYPSSHKAILLTKNSTTASLSRVLAQFSKFPVSMDEYRQDVNAETLDGMLRAAYDGSSNTKCEYDSQTAIKSVTASTIPLVSGEGSSQDAATKSRFISAQMSEHTMKGTAEERSQRYHRMVNEADQYHRIVRFIMMHRTEFSKICRAEINAFSASEDVSSVIQSARSRHTYSLAYACAAALSQILTPNEKFLAHFRKWLIEFAGEADQAVKKSNFINTFWENVLSIYDRDKHSLKNFIFFKKATINEDRRLTIITDDATGDGVYKVFLYRDKPMYDAYLEGMSKIRSNVSLSLSAITAEMKRQPYYHNSPTTGKRQHVLKVDDDSKALPYKALIVDHMPEELKAYFIDHYDNESETENDESPF